MSITLAVGATSVALSPDLHWTDEFDWHPVEQRVERSLTGALLVDTMAATGGRHITLGPKDDQAAWMPRSAIAQLQAWAATAGQQMTLTLRGTPYTVLWRHHDAPALSAEPVIDYADPANDDWYRATLKFMVI